MWFEVGETGDCMVDAMYKEQVCGWWLERQRTL